MTSTHWHRGPLALFDCETTGVDPHRDRIVTAAIVEVTPGADKPFRSSTWLLDPGIDIPEGAAAIHGITTEQAQASGADPAGAVYEIAQHLIRLSRNGIPVVAFNAAYDLTLLRSECVRRGVDPAGIDRLAPVIDPFVLDKWAHKWRKGSRKLVDVARHYGIPVECEAAHGAEYDALLAGRVAWAIANKYPGALMSLMELHAMQIAEKRSQAESFGAYLVKQGRPDDVAREWPIIPPPADWTADQLPKTAAREDVPA